MSRKVEARRSPKHGLGVFALERIRKGSIVERCPVLVLEPEDAEVVAANSLWGYVYDWADGCSAIALGCGSLYNHDYSPSAEYGPSDDGRELVLRATRTIEPGEEVTIDYTGGGQIELWFEPADEPA